MKAVERPQQAATGLVALLRAYNAVEFVLQSVLAACSQVGVDYSAVESFFGPDYADAHTTATDAIRSACDQLDDLTVAGHDVEFTNAMASARSARASFSSADRAIGELFTTYFDDMRDAERATSELRRTLTLLNEARASITRSMPIIVSAQPAVAQHRVPLSLERIRRLDQLTDLIPPRMLDPGVSSEVLGDVLELIEARTETGAGEVTLLLLYIWHLFAAIYLTQRRRVTEMLERAGPR